MKQKEGVILYPLDVRFRPAMIAVEKVCEEYGQEAVATAGLEGEHSAGSLHYYGLAVDFRTHFFDRVTRVSVARRVREELPEYFDVVLEETHLHVELDIDKLADHLVSDNQSNQDDKDDSKNQPLNIGIHMKPFFKSKKFWMAVVGAAIPLLNRLLGLNLDVEIIAPTVASFMSYVVGQGIADLGKNKDA